MSAKRGALSLLVGVAIAAAGCAGEGSTVEIVQGKNARTNVRDVVVAIINRRISNHRCNHDALSTNHKTRARTRAVPI